MIKRPSVVSVSDQDKLLLPNPSDISNYGCACILSCCMNEMDLPKWYCEAMAALWCEVTTTFSATISLYDTTTTTMPLTTTELTTTSAFDMQELQCGLSWPLSMTHI